MSALYTWRSANGPGPPGPMLLKSGEDYFGWARWGDYSCTSLNPVDASFWTVQQYSRIQDPATFLGGPNWGTRVAQIGPPP